MQQRNALLVYLFAFLFVSPAGVLCLELPEKPKAYINDYADLIASSTEGKLNQLLRSFETQTTNQVVIATFPSLEGEALEDFSIRLAEKWQVGQQEKDNGVLFLVFKADRKMRIEVGYGLEGALPDALAGQIINQIVVPQFRAGNFEAGILAGTQAIMKATLGEFESAQSSASGYHSHNYQRPLTPEEVEALKKQARVLGSFVLIGVAIFFVIDWTRYRRYAKEHRIYRERYSFWEWWFRFALLLFVLSFLFRMLFYAMLFSRGGYYGGRNGFGGFSAGGGSFGGGGASGGW